jgi:ATP-dependent DNA helicase 2 subunit 2
MLGVVIDAGAGMGGSLREVKAETGPGADAGEEPTKIALAAAVINYHIVQRQLASKTVEFSVATFGNAEASDGDSKGFKLLCRMGRMDAADMNRIDKLSLGTSPSTDKDFIDGMNGMSDVLSRSNQGKKYNRLMLLMTDSTFMIQNIAKLDTLMSSCREESIILHIAVIGDKESIASSKIVSENLKLFESMVSITGGSVGVISNIGDSIAFFANIAGMNTRSTNYKTIFSLSPTVNIPCVFWGRVMKNTLPSLKKQSHSNGDVKTIVSYRNPDDPDEEIPFDQKVKGYRYGSEYIPMTGLDESSLKLKSNAIVKLLGFLSQDKVPRYHYMDSTQILESEPQNDSAAVAFTALCDALRSTRSVALVRLVKRTDSDPVLAALVPYASEEHDSRSRLMIHRIPCAEDIRDMAFPSLYDARFGKGNTKSQNECMGSFVDAMTISASDLAGGTIITYNPSFPWLSREIVGNLIDNKGSKTLSVPLDNPLSMPAKLIKPNASFAKRLRSEFETSVVDKSKKKKKIYWNELDVVNPEGGVAGNAVLAVRDRSIICADEL